MLYHWGLDARGGDAVVERQSAPLGEGLVSKASVSLEYITQLACASYADTSLSRLRCALCNGGKNLLACLISVFKIP